MEFLWGAIALICLGIVLWAWPGVLRERRRARLVSVGKLFVQLIPSVEEFKAAMVQLGLAAFSADEAARRLTAALRAPAPPLTPEQWAAVERFGFDKPEAIDRRGRQIVEVLPSMFDMAWDAEHTFPFFEGEDGSGCFGYGHQDRDAFAAALNDWDQLCNGGDPEWPWTADEVEHVWAVAYAPIEDAGDLDGWRLDWCGITAADLGAFPMTVVAR